jgi:opacity protein-like surface antigen
MRHRLYRCIMAAATATSLLSPATAVAQDTTSLPMPRAEVSAGYAYMREYNSYRPDAVDYPAGWFAAGAVNLNRWFGIVAELTASHNDQFDYTLGGLQTITNDATVHTFMAGPRFSFKTGRFVPYVQVLVGAARLRLRAAFGEPYDFLPQEDYSTTDFTTQVGGGLTFLVTEHLGLRVAADYRGLLDFGIADAYGTGSQARLLAGFTLNWGAADR